MRSGTVPAVSPSTDRPKGAAPEPLASPVVSSRRGRGTRRQRGVDAVALLKATPRRVTASRVAIIEMLQSLSGPASASEILAALGASAPDRVTVYRTLNVLADSGVIQEVLGFDRVRRFAMALGSPAVLVRFRCIQCGCSMTRRAVLPEAPGFDGCLVTRQSLQVEGRCSSCR